MDRRGYLTGVCATITTAVAGCGGSDGSGGGTPTGSGFQGPTEEDNELVGLQYRDYTDSEVETIKAEAQGVEYDSLARNAEDREGDYIKFIAIVAQNLETDNYRAFLLSFDNAGTQLTYGSWTGDRFLEGDVVSVWAEVLGTETYVQGTGEQKTVPALSIADIELAENGTATSTA